MDEEKIIKLQTETKKSGKKTDNVVQKKGLYQTNPILQEMLVENVNNKKNKFKIKDLFK